MAVMPFKQRPVIVQNQGSSPDKGRIKTKTHAKSDNINLLF